MIQIAWGILLALAGIGVFYRIPQVMPRIEQIAHFTPILFFIKICFYIMGLLLIAGGIRKIINNYKMLS